MNATLRQAINGGADHSSFFRRLLRGIACQLDHHERRRSRSFVEITVTDHLYYIIDIFRQGD